MRTQSQSPHSNKGLHTSTEHAGTPTLCDKSKWRGLSWAAHSKRTDEGPSVRAGTGIYLGVQKILRDLPLRFGTRKGVGEEEHPLAAVHDKEVVWYVGSAQALTCLSHNCCQMLYRVASLKHQTADLQAPSMPLSTFKELAITVQICNIMRSASSHAQRVFQLCDIYKHADCAYSCPSFGCMPHT